MKKVGIIRCQQTEDMCAGGMDFKVAAKGTLAFEKTGPVQIIGFVSCGGCPGKKAVTRAYSMVEDGADIIVLASCISRGTPIGFKCPFFKKMKDSIAENIDSKIEIIEYTH